MWRRFTFNDLRVICHYIGMLLLFFAALMTVPLATAVVFAEWDPAVRYLYSIGITLCAGGALRFCRIEPPRLSRTQALAVVGLAWVVLALFASIPLYFSGHYLTYLDAIFDGVSGLTTTGASLLVDLDHLSYADNMFRFMMHLLGGLGLIVVALSLGIFGRRAAAGLYTSEARSEHILPNVVQATRFIARITAVFIVIATIVLTAFMAAAGIEPVRAVLQGFWVSISGFVTGGFTPMQQSILYYHSQPIEVFLMVLMIMGCISFTVYSECCKGRTDAFFKDIETHTTIIWVLVIAFVFTASLAASTLISNLPALIRRGAFMIVSAFTTTGFSVITVNQLLTVLTSGAFLTLALAMAVGGGAGSTSGGIKIYRVGIIARSIASTIKEAVSPDSARVAVAYYHIGRRILTPDTVKEAMTVFVLYVITYTIGALVGIAHGYDATQAVFESVAMTSNGGIITGLATPGMPATLEIFYIIQMWAGRLEFITLLALVAQLIAGAVVRKTPPPASPGPRRKNPKSKASTQPAKDTHESGEGKGGVGEGEGEGDPTQTETTHPTQAGAPARHTFPTFTKKRLFAGVTCAMLAFCLTVLPSCASQTPSSAVSDTSGAAGDNLVNPSQLTDTSFIYDASISDIEKATSYMDGQTVQVTGEAVGDCIASEYDADACWVTLQAMDGSFSEVAVYMTRSQARVINAYGRYGQVGAKLQVRGTLQVACEDHEGTTEIHAETVQLVNSGYESLRAINPTLLGAGALLCAVGLALLLGYRRASDRMR